MRSLKNHPFAVEAYFDRSTVLAFAFSKEKLERLIPSRLELDTFDDKWGFVAVAMVQTKGLRPKGFPAFLGNDFFLIGYRVFVRYHSRNGKRLRGLFILRSETNKRKMEHLGNIFTHYNYSTIDVEETRQGDRNLITSKKAGFAVEIDRSPGEIKLPEGSPFGSFQEARRFAGPLPHTFTYFKEEDSMLIIEGVRQNWDPVPVRIKDYQFPYLDSLKLGPYVLANAFEIQGVPYYWKKGRIERWK